jgi:mono/diheme cytochrome c family protein
MIRLLTQIYVDYLIDEERQMFRLILFSILASAVVISAAGAEEQQASAADAVRGEAHYAAACAGCHASAARIIRRIDGDTPDEKHNWLERFLADHHAPDAEMRADLIAFLLSE